MLIDSKTSVSLKTPAKFRVVLNAELPSKIFVRPGIFANSSILPFENSNESEDMDILYNLLKTGYDLHWIEGGSEIDVTTFAHLRFGSN